MKRTRKAGFTLVEIMIVVAIIALLAAIAIPNVLRGRTTANESSAIGNMRALMSSLEMYRSVNNVFPNAWTQMSGVTPAYNPPSFSGNVASGVTVQGYTYNYTAGGVPVNTYSLGAIPQTLNQTGTRSFFLDQSGVIYHELGSSGATSSCNTIDQSPSAAASC